MLVVKVKRCYNRVVLYITLTNVVDVVLRISRVYVEFDLCLSDQKFSFPVNIKGYKITSSQCPV